MNSQGNTALHLAYSYGHDSIIEYLVGRKANVEARNKQVCLLFVYDALALTAVTKGLVPKALQLRGADEGAN